MSNIWGQTLTSIRVVLLGFRPCFPVYTQEILSARDGPLCHTKVKPAENIHFESFSYVGTFVISSNRGGVDLIFPFLRREVLEVGGFFFFLVSNLMVCISWSIHVFREISPVFWCSPEFALQLRVNTQCKLQRTTRLLSSSSEVECVPRSQDRCSALCSVTLATRRTTGTTFFC